MNKFRKCRGDNIKDVKIFNGQGNDQGKLRRVNMLISFNPSAFKNFRFTDTIEFPSETKEPFLLLTFKD